MFRSWTFGRKVGGGFVVTAVAILAIAATGYRSATPLIAYEDQVAHSHLVQGQLGELLVQLVNAETGLRGFVITANDDFLEPNIAGVIAVEKAYANVRQLTIDDPSQTRRLDKLRPLIDAKLAKFKERIELRRKAGFEATAAAIAKGDGKKIMDEIRSILGEMNREEAGLLDVRQRKARASTETIQHVLAWGGIIATAFAMIVGWLITTRLSKQIGSAVEHVQSSSTELQAAATQQATGARQQSTAMTQIATTIRQLLASAHQIASSAQRVSDIAGRTANAALTGERTVERGQEASRTARQQVDLSVRHMSELVKKSQQIDAVLDIVIELAEQSNIVAINAAIEAVGAGDAGLRFAIVADELRKIADRVATSTKEIRGMVEEVRSALHTTVISTESGSRAVDLGNAQVVEMATAFQKIASLVGVATDAAKEIELSTSQQATAVEQISRAIMDASGATRETEASASQTLQTAEQLAELSRSLMQIVRVDSRANGRRSALG
jgi:methyl-accepting chemotaxis protein